MVIKSSEICPFTTTDEEDPVSCSTDVREQIQAPVSVVQQQV